MLFRPLFRFLLPLCFVRRTSPAGRGEGICAQPSFLVCLYRTAGRFLSLSGATSWPLVRRAAASYARCTYPTGFHRTQPFVSQWPKAPKALQLDWFMVLCLPVMLSAS